MDVHTDILIYGYIDIYIYIYIYIFPKQCLHLKGSYFCVLVIPLSVRIPGGQPRYLSLGT